VQLDWGEDTRVFLNGVAYTISIVYLNSTATDHRNKDTAVQLVCTFTANIFPLTVTVVKLL